MPSRPARNRLARARDAVLKIADRFPGLHVAVESMNDQVVIVIREPAAREESRGRPRSRMIGPAASRIPRGTVSGELPAAGELVVAIGEHYGGLTLSDVAYRFAIRPRGRLKPLLESLVAAGRLEKMVNRFRVPGTVRPYRTRRRYLEGRRPARHAPPPREAPEPRRRGTRSRAES